VGKFSVYKTKSSELWQLHSPELHVEAETIGDFTCSLPVSALINELQCQ